MTRWARAVDANQADIAKALRRMGASVQHLHTVGNGCPDLLVGWRKRNHVFELKDGTLPPSRRELTPLEARWHLTWRGAPPLVVVSVEEALEVLARLH